MASRTLHRRATYRSLGRHQIRRSHPITRVLLVVLVGFVMLTSGASAGTLFFYGQNLPRIQNFQNKMEFQNTVIQDRYGHKLYDLADLRDRSRGRRIIKPLQWPGESLTQIHANHEDWLTDVRHPGIPAILQEATIATEDASFYSNPGFDPFSIARAAYDNWVRNEVVSGASTITQQLVRRYMHLTGQTLSRKTEEIVLAAELTQKYPKSKILWYYLNSISYGNLAIGAEAAAETYFGRHVWQLDLAQAALLAGLPEAPALYNPMTDKPAALNRMHYVLHLMCVHGYLSTNHCSNPDPPVMISAIREIRAWTFRPPIEAKKYPHFVDYAVEQLQQIPQVRDKVYDGLRVVTTLDPAVQNQAQDIVSNQIKQLGANNVTDGALVSMTLTPDCFGCIRAMVGSADYNAPGGQINMADHPRQPGSSFKPFNYVYGFMHGLSPATTVNDGPIAIPDPGNPDDAGWYEPTNYDHTWHGTVTLRVALDNSLNIPAVKVEQYNASQSSQGLWAIRDLAWRMGMSSIRHDNPHCCGWAFTLGGMEQGVRLVQATAAYATFANNGATVPPTAIAQVYDRTTGTLLYDAKRDGPKSQRIFPAAYAYEMNNVLSDDNSRCVPAVCEFGLHSDLYLGRPAAAKTGTTNGYTDNWTMGYTPNIVTGVWVGNADNSQMVGTTGITGAAPIWHDFMLSAVKLLNLPPTDFWEPPDVYFGSVCRMPGAAYAPGTIGPDIYAGVTPLCTVGTDSTYLPVPQTDSSQTQQQPAAPAAPSAPIAPAPATAVPAPIVQPTVVQQNEQAVPGVQAGPQQQATAAPPVVAPQPTAPAAAPAPQPTAAPPALAPAQPGTTPAAGR